jgi:hypothetical protein
MNNSGATRNFLFNVCAGALTAGAITFLLPQALTLCSGAVGASFLIATAARGFDIIDAKTYGQIMQATFGFLAVGTGLTELYPSLVP